MKLEHVVAHEGKHADNNGHTDAKAQQEAYERACQGLAPIVKAAVEKISPLQEAREKRLITTALVIAKEDFALSKMTVRANLHTKACCN